MSLEQNPPSQKMDYFQFGFFSSLGSSLVMIILSVVGLLFFIPGLIIVLKENKKAKEDKKKGKLILGFILMLIGIVVGFTVGIVLLPMLLAENMGEMF